MSNSGDAIDGVEYRACEAEVDFKIFDTLPKEVRAALRESNFELNSDGVYMQCKMYPPHVVAQNIREYSEWMTAMAYEDRGFSC